MKRGRFAQTATIAQAKRSKGAAEAPGLRIPSGCPDVPVSLSPFAKEEWDRLAADMVDGRRLSRIDRWSLASYCETWSLWRRSVAAIMLIELAETQLWGTDNKGRPLVNADCLVFFDVSGKLLEMATQLGLTARTRHLDHQDEGRPRKPIEQHLLNGDPSRLMTARDRRKAEKALKKQQAVIDHAEKSPPPGMPESAVDEWNLMADQLATHSLYCPLERAALAVGCVAWSVFLMADKQIREQPLTLPNGDTGREVKHPLLSVMRSAWDLVNAVAKEFAMGPLWRKRWKSSVVAGGVPKHLKLFMGSRAG